MTAAEGPSFVYLRPACCAAWLAVWDFPDSGQAKLTVRAPEHGWVQQDDGTWLCDRHALKEQP